MLETASDVAPAEGYGAFLIVAFAILALVGVFAWAALRVGRSGWRPRRSSRWRSASAFGPIRVLARAPLEPGQTLYVVEVVGKAMLLATGEQGVRALADLDGPALAQALDDAEADARPGLAASLVAIVDDGIRRGVGRILGRPPRPTSPADSPKVPASPAVGPTDG